MTFAWPWLLLLFPLYWLIPESKNIKTQGALEHPFLMSLADDTQSPGQKNKIQATLIVFIWCMLVISIARPQWIGEPLQDESKGRALYLSVDLSESMLERDMTWNNRAIERYQAVEAVVGEFVEQRQQDFIGLVVFGSFAEIQSPLTPDTNAINDMLADLRPGMAGGSTAIGDGLALAVKQLRESESIDKVIILLSDGENNSGSVTPEQAMQVAKQSDIKVYTVGFGSDGSNSLLGRFGFGGRGVDEETLKRIATETSGEYFRATNTRELAEVFKLIETLEPAEEYVQDQRLLTELYWISLALALIAMFCQGLIPVLLGKRSLHDAA
jgi:Ca-activated chloride channel family protein